MKRSVLAFLVAIAAALVPLGCARHETSAQIARESGMLILGNGAEPEDLDPHVVTAFTDGNILEALFEGLTGIDEATSEVVPAAAQRWSVSADALVWTFHLRPGLRWSNGEALTAADFIRSWQRILLPKLGSEYAYLLYPIKNAEAYNTGSLKDPSALGLKAPDERTVVITLERPTAYLPTLVALSPWYPVNPRVLARFNALESRGTAWTRPGNLVGNGPFLLKSWSPNDSIVVVKNPAYWGADSVTLSAIKFLPIESPDVEEHDYRAGQIHVTNALPSTKLATYRETRPGELRTDPLLQTFFLRFNVTRPPFGDPRVRQALSLAVDREAISRAVLFGAFPPAHSLTPPNCGGYTSRATVGTDIARARALLAEAGFPEGRGFPAFEVQARNNEIQPKVVEAIQEQWKKALGITITIASTEQKTFLQNQQSLNYTVSMSGWVGDFVDPVTFLNLFMSTSGTNWTGWANPRYDRLLEAAAAARTQAERFEDFQKAEALLLTEGPISPLYHGASTYLIDPSVKGWAPSLLGYHRYTQIHFATP